MINAKDAKQISQANKIIEDALKDIERLILETAGVGRYSIGVKIEDKALEDVFGILTRLGYKITESRRLDYYVVSWEDAI